MSQVSHLKKAVYSKPIMLSPNPFSLFCAILLCLPLAVVFITTPTTDGNVSTAVRHNIIRPNTIYREINSPDEKINPPIKPVSQFSPKPPQNPRSDVLLPPAIPPPLEPLPPEIPPDDEEDLRLFRRASRVNPNHSPATVPRKIAFMFLTSTPLPFTPLWEKFFNGGKRRRYNIYIHADPTKEYNPPFSGVFSGRVIPYSKQTRRNTPTLASAARRLLSYALLDDPANQMFALLSASCIPLHSFPYVYKRVAYSRKSFIEILNNETGTYRRWAARGEDAMLPEVSFEDFRVGSQFWVLTRRHARLVARDVILWKKFRQRCLHIYECYPEEHYFPTLLSKVGSRGVVPATRTHVDWTGRFDGHPKSYNSSEVGPELIQRLRSETPRYGDLGVNRSDLLGVGSGRKDPFLFARKFEPDCLGPLMNISDSVIFRD